VRTDVYNLCASSHSGSQLCVGLFDKEHISFCSL